MSLVYLDRTRALAIARAVAGEGPPGHAAGAPGLTALVFRMDLLDAALGAPRQPYHRTRYDKAGALLRSLIKDHPLTDGNKRLGMAATYLFLFWNDVLFVPDDDDMVEMALHIARSSPPPPVHDIATWIRANSLQIGTPGSTATRLVEIAANDPGKLARLLERGPALLQTRRRTLERFHAAIASLGEP